MKYSKIAVLVASAGLCLAGFTGHAQTIMAFGDSVTSSYSPQNSYRDVLYHMLVEHGFNSFQFVGRRVGTESGLGSDPDWPVDQQAHEGYAGATTDSAKSLAVGAPTADIVL